MCLLLQQWPLWEKKGEFLEGAKPRIRITSKIKADCRYLADKYGDDCPEILLTFLGDAYQPAEAVLGLTRMAIRTLISFNLPFTILTKSALINRDLDILGHYPKFRLGFSFTSVDQTEVCTWEPSTGHIQDRIDTLLKFKGRGVQSWVSAEPVMSVESTRKVIRTLHPTVDFYRIGALNHMDPPEPIDLIDAQCRIMETLEYRHCEYECKKSLTDL